MSSVYVRNRKESKWEPIVYADKVREEFLDLVKRSFGIKHLKTLVRKKYRRGLFEQLFNKSVKIVNKKMVISDNVFAEA